MLDANRRLPVPLVPPVNVAPNPRSVAVSLGVCPGTEDDSQFDPDG
ncbi:MAG: hypothetical protein IT427_14970 [Pirellulales bacterium]|nr:hypothetical protein [Pirellulales bacterium]